MTKLIKDLQIDGPANLLATVPYLLGFNPEKSLVIVAVKGQHDQVVVSMTLDLPDKIEDLDAKFMNNLKETLKRSGADGLVAIFYVETNPQGLQSISDLLMTEISNEFHVRDILWVCDFKWASYLCSDESCCPKEGRKLEIDKPSVAQTELVLAGRSVASKRSDLSNFLEITTVNQDLIPILGQIARQKAKAEHSQTLEKWESSQFKFLTSKKAIQDLDLKLSARLLFGLTDIPIRDALLAHHIDLAQINEDPNQYLFQIAQNWAEVAKVSPETFRPPICTCVAVFMWQAGEGILARSAIEFALAQDPQFHLAKLINNALDSGMPPWEFRDAFTKISNPWS
jgi:hypothetical protein